jgi:protein-tyrosine phosphatase
MASSMFRYVAGHYGGKRPFVLHLFSTLLLHANYWQGLYRVEWVRVERLVFVCQGNICRSPYAAARAASLGLNATSAGLAAKPGYPADGQTVARAEARGLPSLRAHQTASFSELPTTSTDLVICMEPSQIVHIRRMRPGGTLQMTLLGLWARPRRPWLSDPYASNDHYQETCLDIIDNAVEYIASQPGLRNCRRRAVAGNPCPLSTGNHGF